MLPDWGSRDLDLPPKNCTEAHAMGMSNMTPSHACWQSKFDRDKDLVGCER